MFDLSNEKADDILHDLRTREAAGHTGPLVDALAAELSRRGIQRGPSRDELRRRFINRFGSLPTVV